MHAIRLSIPARPRPRITLVLLLFTIVLLLLLGSGCDADKSAFGMSTDPPAWTPPPRPPIRETPQISTDQIHLSHVEIQRTNWIGLTDDPRPVWIVSGHIRNDSDKCLDGLQLHFFFKNGKSKVRRADTYLDLENFVSPSSEDSFSSRIQLPPPRKGWDLYSEVVEARARQN